MVFALWSALAADVPVVRARPEPVLEHARVDLEHLKSARRSQVFSLLSPAVAVAAGYAEVHAPRSPDGTQQIGPRTVATGALQGAALATMVLSATTLHRQAILSRRALLAQGLEVRRGPKFVVPALAFAGSMLLSGLSTLPEGERARFQGGAAAAGLGMYALSVGLGTAQLSRNQQARREAGWLSAAPVPSW